MTTRHVITVTIVLALSAAGDGCKREAERQTTQNAEPVAAPDGSIRLTPEQVKSNGIQTGAVSEQEITSTFTAIGRVTARAGGEAQVFSPFAGRLVADPVKIPRIGSFVRKGEVIAEVEQQLTVAEKAQISGAAAQFGATAAQFQTEIDQAQREAALRQTELERARQLYEGGVIPLMQLQTAEFNLKQAQTRLDGARRTKAQYEAAMSQQSNAPTRAPIRAPISGTVVAADITAGQQTDPAKSLLTIVDLSGVWVEVSIHESRLSEVRRAARVTFTTPANPDRAYTGRIVAIGGVIDPANRSATVIFSVSNPDNSLKVGMTAGARIPGGARVKALLVPASAALTEEGQSLVFVEIGQGVYQRRRVILGERSGDSIVVSDGLKAGEKVVSVGAASLRGETLKGQIEGEGDEKEEKR
jgi:cobalt-zinc-cadmium efflux system membrane fusion protein